VIRVWTSGEIVLASYFANNINAVLSFLLAPPIFQGRQTAAQSLTTGVYTAIGFDAEDIDSAGGHSTSSNTSRYVAQYAGWAEVVGSTGFASNATGRRLNKLRVNGTTDINGSDFSVGSGVTGVLKVTTPPMKIFFNVTDYVESLGAQESGGSLNTAATTVDQSMMGYHWLSN
jgi:hypothetical protein